MLSSKAKKRACNELKVQANILMSHSYREEKKKNKEMWSPVRKRNSGKHPGILFQITER